MPTSPAPTNHLHMVTRQIKQWTPPWHWLLWCRNHSRKRQRWYHNSILVHLLNHPNHNCCHTNSNLSAPHLQIGTVQYQPTPPIPGTDRDLQGRVLLCRGVQLDTKTPTNKQLSVAIRSDMLASLPSSISSIFLNDEIFASDGITVLSYLLTHLNPYSN